MSEPTTAELVEKLRELPEWGEIHDGDPIVQILNRAECALLAAWEYVVRLELRVARLQAHAGDSVVLPDEWHHARAALVALLED